MHQEIITYESESIRFRGEAFTLNPDKKAPLIIVAHAWKGQDKFAIEQAKSLAKLGYVAFAADMYGEGKCVTSNEEAKALMLPLFINRKSLRARISAAYHAACKLSYVDQTKIGAIGFCFGGMTVVELFRSGLDLIGVVSFHGLLGDRLGEDRAKMEPSANKIKGSILALHGNDDPLVTQDDILAFQNEFTKAGVDWQVHTYGATSHAFTNPIANDKNMGMLYNPLACSRAMTSMHNFFDERFNT